MRTKWIDIAKGIGIVLVVLGHCLNSHQLPCLFIRSFHMPLFFLVSGYCLNVEKYIAASLAKNRFASIMLPCLYFTLIQLGVLSLLTDYNFSNLQYHLPGALWFLPILYISMILSLCLIRKADDKIKCVLWFVFLLFLAGYLSNYIIDPNIHSVSSVFSAAGYVVLGVLLKRVKAIEILRGRVSLFIAVVAIMMQPFMVSIFHINIDMVTNKFTPPIWSNLCSITGIYAVITICLNIERYRAANVFSYLGRNSLTIMCLHTIFIAIYIRHVSDFFMLPKMLDMIMQQCFIWITMLILVELINKYCPFLIGKK